MAKKKKPTTAEIIRVRDALCSTVARLVAEVNPMRDLNTLGEIDILSQVAGVLTWVIGDGDTEADAAFAEGIWRDVEKNEQANRVFAMGEKFREN